jgi:bacterioferritin-associated ferredoxin
MYVCSCRATTDREVARAIDGGATTIDDISRACGAGDGCGGCWPTLQHLLDESARNRVGARPLSVTA